MTKPITILCLASYEKGHEFLRECRRQGCRVLLLTSQSIPRESWPLESIDEIFQMPDNNKQWNREDAIKSVSYLARTESIDRIVPLDDFDLELAATLREHLRIPGMGETTTRYFRDKLAMRTKAREIGVRIPDLCPIFHPDDVRAFLAVLAFLAVGVGAENVIFPFGVLQLVLFTMVEVGVAHCAIAI